MIVLSSITPTPIFYSFPYWIFYVWIGLAVTGSIVVALVLFLENQRKKGLQTSSATR